MKSTLFLATTLTVLLAGATACGTADPTADGAAPPTTEEVVTPTTEPDDLTTPTQPLDPPDSSTPPTVAPTTPPAPTPTPTPAPTPAPTTPAPTPPTTPATPRPVATEDVTIDDGTYDSVSEMGADADVVVIGDVVAVDSLGRPFADGNQNTNEYVAVTVSTVDTLTGEPTGEIVFVWQAFATDADGNRTATLLVNGIRPPEVADRLVLFLDPVDSAFNDFLGGVLTHELVKLDGIGYLDGDQVIAAEVGSTASEQLRTMSVNEIRAALAA